MFTVITDSVCKSILATETSARCNKTS